MKSMCAPGVSIGSYASEIILDHIAKHHTVMQGIYTKNIKDLF